MGLGFRYDVSKEQRVLSVTFRDMHNSEMGIPSREVRMPDIRWEYPSIRICLIYVNPA